MFATIGVPHATRIVCVLPSLRASHAAIQLKASVAMTPNSAVNVQHRQGRRGSIAAVAAGEPAGPADSNPIFTGPHPAVIIAGFYIEELPAVRLLLDAAGGHDITLVPCLPTLLDQPLHRALAQGEPQWDEPMPSDWVQGGGWGRQRVVLISDLAPMAANTIVAMLEASPAGVEGLCSLVVGAEDAGKRLGDVLGAAAMAEQGEEGLDGDAPLRFVAGEEALPAVEAAMGGTAKDISAAAAASREEEGEGEGDGDDLDDLIDRIAGGLA